MSDTASKMPARIWATCNGMSTRLPDGHRQFIGGWSEDKDRPRAEAFIRADIVKRMAEALEMARMRIVYLGGFCHSRHERANEKEIFPAIDSALNSYREASNDKA